MKILLALTALLLLVPYAARAADADLPQRLEIAKKLHELRPTADQVNDGIDQVAETQPEAEREAFKTAMRAALNYKTLEKISIDAMAETYTVPELQAMLDYYSKPEAKSAGEKDEEYAKKVYPQITKMLDEAMMRVRTGGQ